MVVQSRRKTDEKKSPAQARRRSPSGAGAKAGLGYQTRHRRRAAFRREDKRLQDAFTFRLR